MPDISILIKQSDYDTKIVEIESKYVSNTGFDSKLAQANVITKRNFDAKIIEIENNTRYELEILHHCGKRVKTKIQKAL